MRCYRFLKESCESAFEIMPAPGRQPSYTGPAFLVECECPEALAVAGRELLDKWRVEETGYWECTATSDNGIDAREERSSKIRDIPFECLVLDNDEFMGVYIPEENRVLCFKSQSMYVIHKEEWVGGWGDIEEGTWYGFIPKE